MYIYFTDNGFTAGALMADGPHLEKSKEVKSIDLDKCAKYIQNKLEYKLRIRIIIKDLLIKNKFDSLTIDADTNAIVHNIKL